MPDVVYINNRPHVRDTIRIKNMVCACCMYAVRHILENHQVIVEKIEPGQAVIVYDTDEISLEGIHNVLTKAGTGLIRGREELIADNIRKAVFDLIHRMNNVNSIVQKSDYLVEKLGMNYQQLSRIFSKYHSVTLEKYIILNKIERIKELIDQDEFSLTEIAYMMDYSSVHYLSNQFKKFTGFSVSDYKSGKGKKITLNSIGEK